MKIAHKVGIAAAAVLFLTTSLLSLAQVSQVESSISESSNALARQIENWLNAKLRLMDLMDLMAQSMDSDYSLETTQRVIDSPMLKNEFILVFGALQADGKPIKNDPSWQPKADWDGRQRPGTTPAKAATRHCSPSPMSIPLPVKSSFPPWPSSATPGRSLACSAATSA